MKVLLDENLDHALRRLLGSHEVVTVAYMGWAGLKNGELIRTAEENGVEVLLTGDTTLGYEQNLAGRHLAVVALSAALARLFAGHSETLLAPFISNMLLRSVVGSLISTFLVIGGLLLALAALKLTHVVLSILGLSAVVGLAEVVSDAETDEHQRPGGGFGNACR